MNFRVTADEAGQRLDVLLARKLGCSRAQAARELDAGRVRLDGRSAGRADRPAVDAEVVHLPAPPPAPTAAPPLPPVRYRDDHLLVLAKPAGLVVHPGAGHPDGTLVDALRAAGEPLAPAGGPERPGIVHRLDRDTSGLLVVARTDAAYHGLVAALKARSVQRRYLTLVVGAPDPARGRIDAPIGRDPRVRTRFAVLAGGKPAVTRYRTLALGAVESDAAAGRPGTGPTPVGLLLCALETGRTHQIRVHLTGLGHPVVGDRVYGPRPALATALGLTGPALHAVRLALAHPVTGEQLEVVEPLPAALDAALTTAGLDPAQVVPAALRHAHAGPPLTADG